MIYLKKTCAPSLQEWREYAAIISNGVECTRMSFAQISFIYEHRQPIQANSQLSTDQLYCYPIEYVDQTVGCCLI
jgi:hypothetical protein